MMIFKKLSLMGLLATAIVGGHVTSAYGMNSEQDPNQIRAQKKADRRACKAACHVEMPTGRTSIEIRFA